MAALGAAGVGGSRVTPAEVEQYIRDGYVVVSDLISPAVCSAAADAVWAQMSGPPKLLTEDKWATPGRQRPRRRDAASWGGSWAGIVDGDAVLASFSAECLRAAEVLSSASERVAPYPTTQHPIGPPTETLAVNTFPAEPGAEWSWPEPHTDSGATDSGGDGWMTVPRPVRLQHITYLTGPAPGRRGGGGTVVWPGSHRKLEALWQADNAGYEWMGAFAPAVPGICAGITPVEVMPAAGDVL